MEKGKKKLCTISFSFFEEALCTISKYTTLNQIKYNRYNLRTRANFYFYFNYELEPIFLNCLIQ